MNKKKFVPLAIILFLLITATLYFEVFRHLGGRDDRVDGSGTIEVTEIEISSKLAGRVTDLPRQEGETVKKGDLVVRLNYEELSAQQLSALANMSNAEKNVTRIRNLYATGSVSKRDLDNAETAYLVARGTYNQVSATIENAVIFAPISGTVLDTNLEVGEMAFPGTPIVTLADLTRPWMYIYVNETKLGMLRLGQKALVYIDSYPDRPFKGKVTAISNKAEFTPKTIQTRDERVKLVFAVKIVIENPDLILKPGMPGDAEVILREGGK